MTECASDERSSRAGDARADDAPVTARSSDDRSHHARPASVKSGERDGERVESHRSLPGRSERVIDYHRLSLTWLIDSHGDRLDR